MWPGWDNTVSRIYFWGVAGGIVIYGRTFYRDHLQTIVNFGGAYYLQNAANDNMSSGLKLL
jgi:hypothetical protein